jgi:hypothetical protein
VCRPVGVHQNVSRGGGRWRLGAKSYLGGGGGANVLGYLGLCRSFWVISVNS